jgi:hypothetical protein
MASNAKAKVSAYRRRLRERKLRPLQIWVPDLKNPDVLADLQAEVRMLKHHRSTREGEAFVEAALSDLADELRRLEGEEK